jgi:putative ABC transport system permease protein
MPLSLVETWNIASAALREHKARTALSTLGVVLGSASIVIVISVAATGQDYVIAQIEGIGANLVYAQRAQAGPAQPESLADELTLDDLDSIRSVAGVTTAAGTRDEPATVVASGDARAIRLIGVTNAFQRIRNLTMVDGRYLDDDELASGAHVCVLTEELAQQMFPAQRAVGELARIDEIRLTIVGTFRERVSTFGASEIQRESAIVPIGLMPTLAGSAFLRVVYAQAASADEVPEVTRAVRATLEAHHRPGVRFDVQNLTGLLAAARRISTALLATLVVVALVAIVISGIGIMNVMLVTVADRTREIGVRKAVGATRRAVLAQFLLESALIGAGGAIGGIVMAIVLLVSAPLLFLPNGISLRISPLAVLIAFAVAGGAGVLFGYLPARRAAGLEAVDALRHE